MEIRPTGSIRGRFPKRRLGESSKRLQEDSYAKFKYDKTAQEDAVIIDRVAQLAQRHDVSMSEVALAWLLTKVTAPVVGATKMRHVDTAVKTVELELTPEEIQYLQEPYVPHAIVGVVAQNMPESATKEQVWTRESPKG